MCQTYIGLLVATTNLTSTGLTVDIAEFNARVQRDMQAGDLCMARYRQSWPVGLPTHCTTQKTATLLGMAQGGPSNASPYSSSLSDIVRAVEEGLGNRFEGVMGKILTAPSATAANGKFLRALLESCQLRQKNAMAHSGTTGSAHRCSLGSFARRVCKIKVFSATKKGLQIKGHTSPLQARLASPINVKEGVPDNEHQGVISTI